MRCVWLYLCLFLSPGCLFAACPARGWIAGTGHQSVRGEWRISALKYILLVFDLRDTDAGGMDEVVDKKWLVLSCRLNWSLICHVFYRIRRSVFKWIPYKELTSSFYNSDKLTLSGLFTFLQKFEYPANRTSLQKYILLPLIWGNHWIEVFIRTSYKTEPHHISTQSTKLYELHVNLNDEWILSF